MNLVLSKICYPSIPRFHHLSAAGKIDVVSIYNLVQVGQPTNNYIYVLSEHLYTDVTTNIRMDNYGIFISFAFLLANLPKVWENRKIPSTGKRVKVAVPPGQ